MFLDDPTFSNIIFYPRKHSIPRLKDPKNKILKFQINDEIIIGGFFYENEPNLPTILLFHGNGELAIEYEYFKKYFFDCNVNLAVVDFRGYGFSTGRPFFSSLYKDAMLVFNKFIEWISNNNYNESIFVLGRSLGSHCAAEIGSHNPEKLKGIIFESAIGNTYKIMQYLFRISLPGISQEEFKEWSNDNRASKFKKPTLIIHGTNDWIVPPEHAEILYEALPDNIEKRLVLIEGASHNDIFQFEKEYFNALREFIAKFK